ncbi:MAG: glycosyl transferase family 1 [Candidatus Nitrosocaldaceae archaeon]|nr:MAG: glycosyl transferase family 1 [Candidatus Nitrosocaldaceae archaeon]
MKVGFVSTYLPTNCGIAKFNNSLEDSLKLIDNSIQTFRIRMIVPEDLPRDDVFINIKKYDKEDYIKAAKLINESDIDLICLQHEYGIFGGEYGDYILTFLEHLNKPVVSVLHKLDPDMQEYARMIVREIWYKSSKVIVILPDMHNILKEKFGINEEELKKYVYIPHGVPVVDISKKDEIKRRLGLDGKYVLLSFGLFKTDKGLEYAIEALPIIIDKFDNVIYLIIGKDHPEFIKREGYSYLQTIKDKVKELGLERYVMFIERFFNDEQELSNYLLAGDILLTPYLGLNRVSSGVIVYGMAHGMCIITTPFMHARRDITNDIGRIVRDKDSKGIAEAVIDIIKDKDHLKYMQKMAYEHVKDRQWPKIANRYLQVFKEIINS